MEIKNKVLIIEDERRISNFLCTVLKANNYDVISAITGNDACAVINSHCPDVIILDLGLPDMDGTEILRSVRKWSSMPIIVVSARSSEKDKVTALELGADDYITKPFSPSELTARIDAVYRRVSMSFIKEEKTPVIRSGPFELNLKSRTVSKNGVPIDLTQVEYQILEYFMNNQNTALDRSSILTHIWGENYFGDDKIVDVNIRRIRMKIEDEPSNPKYISTIWGFGYKWSGDGNPDDDKK